MLTSVLVWLYIAALALVYGRMTNHLLARMFRIPVEPPLPLTLINGLLLLNWLLAVLQLFLRIHLLMHGLILLGAAVYIALHRAKFWQEIQRLPARARAVRPIPALVFLALAGYILLLIVMDINHSDTGLYHAPTVRWFEEYPIVPGLGNLHGRLAFNSLWFVLSAFFSLSFLGPQPFYVLNGFTALVFAAYCLGLAFRKPGAGEKKSILVPLVAGFLAALPMFTLEFSFPSLSPDLPSTILVWLVLLLFLQKHAEESPFTLDGSTLLMMLYAAYAITLKVAAGPILLAPALLLVGPLARRQWKPVFRAGLLAVVLVAPWFARSYFLSGYLVYPVQAVDIFHPDWKMPAERVALEAAWVRDWAANRYQVDQNAVLRLAPWEWFSFWYAHPTLWIYEELIATSYPIALAMMAGSFVADGVRRKNFILPLTYLVVVVGCFFWFLNAPAPRFALGFLMMLFFLPLAQAVQKIFSTVSNRNLRRGLYWGVIAAVALYFAVSNAASISRLGLDTLQKRNLIYQAGYAEPEVTSTVVDHQKIYYPAQGGEDCWYAELPCAPSADLRIGMRRNDLRDGFRYRP